ncbi:hypothetical protein AB0G04_25635 [Actinoplanes sp. NPDC023801]|uniref:hypothetical protein n=1 Tax=Actinoplanes sp. NPDC023801 TaxID=3154595 RepID=UPI0033C733C7
MTSTFFVSLAGVLAILITVFMNSSAWDPLPGAGSVVFTVLFTAGCQLLILLLTYLGHRTNKQWEERLSRHCIGIVHAGLGDSFDGFLTEQHIELPAGLRTTLDEAARGRAALDRVTVPPD